MSLREDNLELFADSKSEVIFGGGGILGWSDPNFLSYPGEVPIRGGGAILKLLGNFKSELTKKPPPPPFRLVCRDLRCIPEDCRFLFLA